jgi:hypothetical protein
MLDATSRRRWGWSRKEIAEGLPRMHSKRSWIPWSLEAGLFQQRQSPAQASASLPSGEFLLRRFRASQQPPKAGGEQQQRDRAPMRRSNQSLVILQATSEAPSLNRHLQSSHHEVPDDRTSRLRRRQRGRRPAGRKRRRRLAQQQCGLIFGLRFILGFRLRLLRWAQRRRLQLGRVHRCRLDGYLRDDRGHLRSCAASVGANQAWSSRLDALERLPVVISASVCTRISTEASDERWTRTSCTPLRSILCG